MEGSEATLSLLPCTAWVRHPLPYVFRWTGEPPGASYPHQRPTSKLPLVRVHRNSRETELCREIIGVLIMDFVRWWEIPALTSPHPGAERIGDPRTISPSPPLRGSFDFCLGVLTPLPWTRADSLHSTFFASQSALDDQIRGVNWLCETSLGSNKC